MVDIVVNNVMATSTTPDYSTYFFKDPVSYRYLHICVSKDDELSAHQSINPSIHMRATEPLPPILPDQLGKYYK